jgi:uncharacterized protein involved in cysteine biosynthesis
MYKPLLRTMILSALLLAAVSAGAQTLWTVDFVSGKVEYQVKGTKMVLAPGTKVAEDIKDSTLLHACDIIIFVFEFLEVPYCFPIVPGTAAAGYPGLLVV